MSHNKITVAGQSPDSSGEVSVALSNLSDVSVSSVSADEVLKYNGSTFVNAAVPVGTGEYIQLGRGENFGSSYPFDAPSQADRVIYFYDTSPINTIQSATLHEDSFNSDWYDSITLPAGQYMIMCQTNVKFSQTGYLVYALKAGNVIKSVNAKIGDGASSYSGGVVSTINYCLNLTSATRLYLKVVASSYVSTTAADHNNYIDEFTYIIVVKV